MTQRCLSYMLIQVCTHYVTKSTDHSFDLFSLCTERRRPFMQKRNYDQFEPPAIVKSNRKKPS